MLRQRIEIMTAIVRLCKNPSKKTRIMYRTNLSYAQLKNYLALLTSNGLLQSNSSEYAATDKGLLFLDAFAQLNKVLEDSHIEPYQVADNVREVQIISVTEKDNF